ncbi:hypothetical protein [Candidatus Tisiphia endosymbiont of Piscicola geometra]|uniref:hypothetical protein n=1 Tax=Candidatus Tisiphia endosymbiont of Piscicola geometra TaxID=3066273 RepID=UPI00312CBC7E
MRRMRQIVLIVLVVTITCAEAQYLDPINKTNINEVDPLFEKNIDNYQSWSRQIEDSKAGFARGVENSQGLGDLVGHDKLQSEADRLSSIEAEDLSNKGWEESAKDPFYNEMFVDYSRPGMMAHKQDAEMIANASGKMMDNLLGQLRDIGVDCKTVKGNKEIEPQYFMELSRRDERAKGDTIYDQYFCERLRNRYACVDGLTLQCLQFSEKPAELTISQSSMKYTPNIAGLVKRISFVEQYGPKPCSLFMRLFGGGGESSSYGGGTVHGFINKASGTTYHAQEATWQISFNISAKVAMLTKVQLTAASYGTFIMFKLNGQVIFVGPVNGNNLFLNGYRSVETKGERKYGGLVGKRMTVTTNYPIVSTGFGEYALGLDSIADRSRAEVINLLPHIRQGDNILEIKAIGRGNNEVSFNLDVSERICTYWQEYWREQCRLE